MTDQIVAQESVVDIADYPSLKKRPKYGYRLCKVCQEPFGLYKKRDVGRKVHCSKECRHKTAIARAREVWSAKSKDRFNEPTKVCKDCQNEYPQTEEFFSFSKRSKGRPVVSAYCRWCHSIRSAALAKKNYGGVRNRVLLQRYGITLDDFNQMVIAQNNVCAICQTRKPVCVDHCHTTGKVRGLLCNGCNAAIGIFAEDINVFQRAIQYLGLEVVNATL